MPSPSDSSRLTARFWGVRGSIPTPQAGYLGVGGNTSCVEVRAADGTTLVLDAGTGIRALGYALAAEAAGEARTIHVLLSHFHWDHLQGLPFFAPLFVGGNEVVFYAATADDRLDRLLHGQMCFPYFPVPFDDLAASTRTVAVREGEDFQIGPMTVRAFPVNHPQGAHGYRIECGGATLVYATDHEHGVASCDVGLLEAARGADVLISDAQYTPDEYRLRAGWGHTTWEKAAELARDAGVGKLYLFHHDPAHDDAALARICECAREIHPAAHLACEGDEVRI